MRSKLLIINTIEKINADVHVLAITATANKKVEADIQQQLAFKQGQVEVQRHSMRRDNLQLSVMTADNVSEKLFIRDMLATLSQRYSCGALLTLPSSTWTGRLPISEYIAQHLKIPLFLDALQWTIPPESRQGELLNNDQRRFNVDKKMQLKISSPLPKGNLLLLDDYTGSGATLKEACRAIKPFLSTNQKIVPMTIASIRWRLGKRGMI